MNETEIFRLLRERTPLGRGALPVSGVNVSELLYDIPKREMITCHFCKKKVEKHINKDGARYHVLSWSLMRGPTIYSKGKALEHCSEKLCEVNHRQKCPNDAR